MDIKYLTHAKDSSEQILGKYLEELFSSKKGTYSSINIITNSINKETLETLKVSLNKALKNSTVKVYIKNSQDMSLEDIKAITELNIDAVSSKDMDIENNFSWYIFEGKNIANVVITTSKCGYFDLYVNNVNYIVMSYNLKDEVDKSQLDEFKTSIQKYLKAKKKDLVTLKSIEETMEKQFESDSFEIELPSGELIDLSLDNIPLIEETEQTEVKETKTKKVKKKSKEIKEFEETFEPEIEMNKVSEFNEFIGQELSELHDEDTEDVKKDNVEIKYITPDISVGLDIEQMLFEQNKANLGFKSEMPKPEKANTRKNSKHLFEPVEDKNVWRADENSNNIIPIKRPIEDEFDADKFFAEEPKTVKTKIIINSMNKTKTKINTFFLQVNKLDETKAEIKIPALARDYDTTFWGWPDNYEVIEAENGKKIKIWDTTCNVINVEHPELTKIDNIKLYQQEGQNVFCIYLKLLGSFKPDENDILRLIRVDKENYTFECELIRQNSKEYVIWKQFCTYGVTKSSERKYGFG